MLSIINIKQSGNMMNKKNTTIKVFTTKITNAYFK